MGTRALTIRDWLLFSGSMIATSTIAAFLSRFLSILLTNNPPRPPITITVFGFSGLTVLLLLFLRFRKSRTFRLELWIGLSPWLVSSVYVLPTLPFLLIPLVWLILILLSLWGYYGRFKMMFDTRLH